MNYTVEDLALIEQGRKKANQYARALTRSYRINDPAIVEDIVGDFLLTVFSKWDERKSGLSTNVFIYNGVRNCLSNYLRKSPKGYALVDFKHSSNHQHDPSIDLEIVRKALLDKKGKDKEGILKMLERGNSMNKVAKHFRMSSRDIKSIASGTYKEKVTISMELNRIFLQGYNCSDAAELTNRPLDQVEGHFSYLRKKAKSLFPDLCEEYN